MSRSKATQTPPSTTPQNDAHVELYVAMTNHGTQPEHWAILLRTWDSDVCTRYHVQGGLPPSSYVRCVEPDKPFNSPAFRNKELICVLDWKHLAEILKACYAVSARRSQVYVLDVLKRLEATGNKLVPAGTVRELWGQFQKRGIFEGPTRVVGEDEWESLVAGLGPLGAHRYLLQLQGWLKEWENGSTGPGSMSASPGLRK
ncbi:hypothetical protein BDW74DRAFT_175669 [Aspergillus multicolor]|uniref:uncharacterized protein n=1 Tax=Aspergillus multicolor TaxID=41759 RepID=UPI003CCD0187